MDIEVGLVFWCFFLKKQWSNNKKCISDRATYKFCFWFQMFPLFSSSRTKSCMHGILDNYHLSSLLDTTKCYRDPTIYPKVLTTDNFCTCTIYTSCERGGLSCSKPNFHERSERLLKEVLFMSRWNLNDGYCHFKWRLPSNSGNFI